MTINNSKHELVLTSGECYEIAYNIFYSLERTVKEHWVNYPDVWKERERERIEMMTTFFNLANYSSLVPEHIRKLEEHIQNARK